MILSQLLIKADYSGHFSVSLRPKPKPRDFPLGLAVPLSGTSDKKPNLAISNRDEPHILDDGSSKTKRRPRGSSGLTAFAKRLLVGAVNWIENQYGKHRLIFHTATLPSDNEEIKLLCLRKSKEILKYWRKVLSRLLKSACLPHEDIVIVLELQKRGAIHFHSIFINDRIGPKRYKLSLEQLDNAWRQALCAVVPQLRAYDFSKACRTERVRKSAGRYLAKYFSKADSKITQKVDFAITWYSIGNHLKQIIKDLAQKANAVAVEFDFQSLRDLLVQARKAWNMFIFSHEQYGDRNLSGYYDHREDFLKVLQPLLFQCGVLSFVKFA